MMDVMIIPLIIVDSFKTVRPLRQGVGKIGLPIKGEGEATMRRAMVTRTIESTEVTVMALDVIHGEPLTRTYNIAGTYKDEAKLLKAVQSAYDTDEVKNVHVVDSKVVGKLYGMYENDFLKVAIELDSETRKPIGGDTEITEE